MVDQTARLFLCACCRIQVLVCRRPPGPDQLPVKEFLRDTFAAQPLAHWESLLTPLDVCWAPVRTVRQALLSEQIRVRGMRVDVAQKGHGGGMVTELGIPIKFRREPGRIDPEIPLLGEHTFPVLQLLGLSAEEVARASGLPIPPAA